MYTHNTIFLYIYFYPKHARAYMYMYDVKRRIKGLILSEANIDVNS